MVKQIVNEAVTKGVGIIGILLKNEKEFDILADFLIKENLSFADGGSFAETRESLKGLLIEYKSLYINIYCVPIHTHHKTTFYLTYNEARQYAAVVSVYEIKSIYYSLLHIWDR